MSGSIFRFEEKVLRSREMRIQDISQKSKQHSNRNDIALKAVLKVQKSFGKFTGFQ